MKVAHVITRMIVGGAQENTLDSVLGLRRLYGHEVTLITGPELGPEGSLLAVTPTNELRVLTVRSLCRNVSPIKDVFAFFALCKIFLRERFDIIHTHSSKAGILGRMAARVARASLVVHTVHGFAMGPYQGSFLNIFYRLWERCAAKWTDILVCVSPGLASEAKRMGLVPRKEIVVIRSGFDWKLFSDASDRQEETRGELAIELGVPVLVMVARFFPLKGHAELFEILDPLWKRYPRLKLVLVGDGPLREKFEERARHRGWSSRIIFTGLVSPARVAECLGAADLVLHTSLREGLARVIPQAFACRRPVVCYDLDGAEDLVRDGVTGFLVNQKDPEGLLNCVLRVLDSPGLRQSMGNNGYALAEKHYDANTMVQALAQVYRGYQP